VILVIRLNRGQDVLIFSSGVAILAIVLSAFYLKDILGSPWLARLAYSEITMRITVFAVALILIGALLMIRDFLK